MGRGCLRFATGLAGSVESTANAKEDGKVRKHEVPELMHVSEDIYRKRHGSIRNIAGIKKDRLEETTINHRLSNWLIARMFQTCGKIRVILVSETWFLKKMALILSKRLQNRSKTHFFRAFFGSESGEKHFWRKIFDFFETLDAIFCTIFEV